MVELAAYRAQLYEYLKSRMAAIAPNLTVLVGELVGARLIAHAGSLMTLAKYPASTVQILGAEKARLCLPFPFTPHTILTLARGDVTHTFTQTPRQVAPAACRDFAAPIDVASMACLLSERLGCVVGQ